MAAFHVDTNLQPGMANVIRNYAHASWILMTEKNHLLYTDSDRVGWYDDNVHNLFSWGI